jgi:uncharacterized protein YoxC
VAVETLLIILASAMALAMVCQAVFLWRLSSSAKKLMARLNAVTSDLESDARGVLDQLRDIVASLDHLREVSEGVESRVGELDQMFGERVQDIDHLVGKLLEVGSRQAEKVDSVVTDTVDKFEETTAVIQQDIVRPVVEISSLVKGLKTGLDYLFSKRELRSEEKYPEDQLFI